MSHKYLKWKGKKILIFKRKGDMLRDDLDIGLADKNFKSAKLCSRLKKLNSNGESQRNGMHGEKTEKQTLKN